MSSILHAILEIGQQILGYFYKEPYLNETPIVREMKEPYTKMPIISADTHSQILMPLFTYLRYNHQVNEIILKEYYETIEDYKNKLRFDDEITPEEVTQYYNDYISNKTICNDDKYNNSELYIFIRFIFMIVAVDSYGPCETIEEMELALERGKQFLEIGILEKTFNMRSAKKYAENYMNWKLIKDWILKFRYPASFTKKEILDSMDKEKMYKINKEWRESLRVAFDRAGI
jgi:hypothetical protein